MPVVTSIVATGVAAAGTAGGVAAGAGAAAASGGVGEAVAAGKRSGEAKDAQAEALTDNRREAQAQERFRKLGNQQVQDATQAGLTSLSQGQQQGQQFGQQALNTLSQGQNRSDNLLNNGIQGFEQSPGFQFAQQQGEQAINRAAAARGGRLSGRALQELGQFNTGLAQQDFNNFANRQVGLAGAADVNQANQLSGMANILGQQAQFSNQAGQGGAALQAGMGQSLLQNTQFGAANQIGLNTQRSQLRFAHIPFEGQAEAAAGRAVSEGGQATISAAKDIAGIASGAG